MRARNLKPAIFSNEFLAVSDPLYTIIFEGLWCIADREGLLEDRPAKIHMKINPGRAFEGTERSLVWLEENGFIRRYSIGQARYIQVIKFLEHQNPHQKEAPSKIPKPGASPVRAQEDPDASTSCSTCEQVMDDASARLIPSSLTPDSGLLTPDSTNPVHASVVSRDADQEWFLNFKLAYPNRAGDQNWSGAVRASNARIKEGHTPQQMLDGGRRYAAYCDATGSTDTQYVKTAAVFLGPAKHFMSAWDIPPNKADRRLNKNLDVMAQFIAGSSK